MPNPYQNQPDHAFWKRAVSENFVPQEMFPDPEKFLSKSDKIVSAGSCFASNIVPFLDQNGYSYLRFETPHSKMASFTENLGYGEFSAAYGNIYTPRHFLQLLQRANGSFLPCERYWREGDFFIDPFRPGLRFNARSESEFDQLTSYHLAKTVHAFNEATVILFTFGLTEAWASKEDGAVYPACPGTIRGTYDQARHEMLNFSVEEIVSDMRDAIAIIRQTNPSVRFILTVSPVPLVATATKEHVVIANSRSKSVLRSAADMLCRETPDCFYFPSFEVITGPQAPSNYFESDRRSVSETGIRAVMSLLIPDISVNDKSQNQELLKLRRIPPFSISYAKKVSKIYDRVARKIRIIFFSKPKSNGHQTPNPNSVDDLSKFIAKIECDELMQDPSIQTELNT